MHFVVFNPQSGHDLMLRLQQELEPVYTSSSYPRMPFLAWSCDSTLQKGHDDHQSRHQSIHSFLASVIFTCFVSIKGLHPLEEHLKANYVTKLSKSEGSSRCSPQMLLLLPVFGGCTAAILCGLTYPKILCAPQKEDRREKMVTLRGVDCHFHTPRRQISWRYGKTSGDATRKCSKG